MELHLVFVVEEVVHQEENVLSEYRAVGAHYSFFRGASRCFRFSFLDFGVCSFFDFGFLAGVVAEVQRVVLVLWIIRIAKVFQILIDQLPVLESQQKS